MSNLSNAHKSFNDVQHQQHKYQAFFEWVDAFNDKTSELSGKLDEKLEGIDTRAGGYVAEHFGFVAALPAMLDKAFDAAVIPDSENPHNFTSLSDIVSDWKETDVSALIDSIPPDSIFRGLKNDTAKKIIYQFTQNEHKPSEIFSLKSAKDFLKESIVNKDGFLHAMIIGGAFALNPIAGMAVSGLSFLYNLGSSLLGLRKAYVEKKKAKGANKAAQNKTWQDAARLNAATGHQPFTNIDSKGVLEELKERMRDGKGLSPEEMEGLKAYINEANENRTGAFLDGDLGQHSKGSLQGYRFAMGLAAGFGGAKALEFLMDNDMFNGFGGASGQSAEAAGDVAGVIGGAAAGAAQNGATSVSGVVAAASAGGVSVQAVRNSLNAVLQSIGLDKNAILTQANQVGSLASAVRATANGTNDESLKRAEQLLMQAREGLTQISNMLGQSQEQAHRYGQQL